jgi:hypothetical protein
VRKACREAGREVSREASWASRLAERLAGGVAGRLYSWQASQADWHGGRWLADREAGRQDD